MDHSIKAAESFLSGYNCAQAVMVAFCDVTGLEEKAAAKMISPFGGGMGRMREVCGAVSGMFMVLGVLYGYDENDTDVQKKQLYKDVQALAEKFRAMGYDIPDSRIINVGAAIGSHVGPNACGFVYVEE